ncbi:Two-component sensor histidine kinase [Legionella lansingensis]|uniref:histidine kinase n=1 Tax=Legionella lansingensis TaxID=45067 RepID=A0A0W0VWY9_9GAMM|nr:ATP-binding protein [Legionella lansingensis]KTD24727.1 Two-component sensor histidine kinase [Legionella lansingensis]SNV53584.1 Two-component sensor histidine kinase [Legionella lansingensis]
MELHKLLARQITRTGMTTDDVPNSLEKWQEFLLRINKTYQEADQERYLLDRSIDISSREMMVLNEKLERAQHIAQLCYWHYSAKTDEITWSKEFSNLIDADPLAVHTFQEFLKLVHPDDRVSLQKLVKKSLTQGINYMYELRVKNRSGHYQWYRTIAECQEKKNQLSGILIDINHDKKNEEKIKELSNKLLMTAHRAGMSEIATSILHNIGNILNSSNISANMLKDSLEQPYYLKLFKVIEMIKNNRQKIIHFFSEDEKGKLIPDYLIALGEILAKEREKNREEIINLDNDLQHIKDIVSMQKFFSGVSGIYEKIYVPELIETALDMSSNPIKDRIIDIQKNYLASAFVFTDKSKLLQILVNLIQNAKDAVLRNTLDKKKQVKFKVNTSGKNTIQILVEDNGIGILPENLDRIFSFGFTTKPHGHGFGLHSCALSAQDMGGSLRADSPGLGQGAVFTLTLPIKNSSRKRSIL